MGNRVYTKVSAPADVSGGTKLQGTYDTATGNMSWVGQDGNTTWSNVGAKLTLPAQVLRWQAGQSSVLYLHFENMLSPDNSRGQQPQLSTCAAKMALDPTSLVNNIIQTRAHRWIEIPTGAISQVKFFVRSAAGQIVDLVGMGCAISFTLTIAPRGGG